MTEHHPIAPPPPELSYTIALERVSPKGFEVRFEATPEECQALAKRYNILAVESLSAQLTLTTTTNHRRATAEGKVIADVVQACVVTLEPVREHLEIDFHRLFMREEDIAPHDGEIMDHTPDLGDEPALIEGDAVDLGEAVAEEVALSLDPYPRAPGADVSVWQDTDDEAGEGAGKPPNPFAVLAELKNAPGKTGK